MVQSMTISGPYLCAIIVIVIVLLIALIASLVRVILICSPMIDMDEDSSLEILDECSESPQEFNASGVDQSEDAKKRN